MNTDRLLDEAALKRLTGRSFKSKQIEWLLKERIPFRVNATGHPVVAWSAVEGRKEPEPAAPQQRGWTPRVIEKRA